MIRILWVLHKECTHYRKHSGPLPSFRSSYNVSIISVICFYYKIDSLSRIMDVSKHSCLQSISPESLF